MKITHENCQNKRNISYYLMFVLLLTLSTSIVQAQVKVPFTQRTSNLTNPPGQKIYNIKGDYRMIGNTNLTLETYGTTTPNSNNDMVYVDIDGVSETVNSSSAELTFSTENNADPNCSNVIFAGLYWTGRAHNAANSPQIFTTDGTTENFYHNGTINSAYTLSITSVDGPGSHSKEHTATYTFTPNNGGDPVVFIFHTYRISWGNWHEETTVTVGSGTPITLSGDLDNSGGNLSIDFDTPYIINTGAVPIKVNRLRKAKDSNTIDNDFRANVTYGGKTLDKRKVKLRYNTEAYIDITANASDIWYPSGTDENMYAAYADVTSFVRDKGLGTYTVADMALREGNGSSVGYYGGWALIVVYENSKMNWRDVTIFDGYAFVQENNNGGWQEHIVDVQGYQAAQTGAVNVKIGIVAGEGDRGVGGSEGEKDALYIQRDNNTWMALSHDENTEDNFFVSSIVTQGTRNPNLYNNTGLDIVSIDINNPGNTVIGNNDTETKLKYGTNQDTYALLALAMSIDAYVPESEAFNEVSSITGGASITGPVLPGEEITYQVEIRNKGTEAINNFVLNIPIPYTTTFVSCNATYHSSLSPTPAQPAYDPNLNSIILDIGTLPKPTDPATVLATMTYTLKVTEDCFILSNPTCNPKVEVTGTSSGVGATSGTNFADTPMVTGFQDGGCAGEPITDPLSITIDRDNFCNGQPGFEDEEFSFCITNGNTIPFEEISVLFPEGFHFYGVIDEATANPDTNTEFTPQTGFPDSQGAYYYALPSGLNSGCFWRFKVIIESYIRTNKNVTKKL